MTTTETKPSTLHRVAQFMDVTITRLSPSAAKATFADAFGVLRTSKSKGQKRVRFLDCQNLLSIYPIEPYLEYSSDLWWSKEELAFLSSHQQASMISDSLVQTSMQVYRKARTQVYFDSKLDQDIFEQLIFLKQNGYDEVLDRFNSARTGHSSRQKHIRNTIASIVKVYSESMQQQRSKSFLSKYAMSLTKTDSLWAMYMARVDADVVTVLNHRTNDHDSDIVESSNNIDVGRACNVTRSFSPFWKRSPMAATSMV